jgi:hypothetical protein
MINGIVEVKFNISNYSHNFRRIGTEYRGLVEIVIKEHYNRFPVEGHNSNFTDVEFHSQQWTNFVQT